MNKVAAITQIHEVELSSRCNLACVYCPHPNLGRAKADMNGQTFARVLEHLSYYCVRETQGELALTGIGEALLDPLFAFRLRAVREVLGPYRKLTLATNGLAVTEEAVQLFIECDVEVWVSLHRPEIGGKVINELAQRGVRVGANHAFVDSSLDWAGQVDWHVSAPKGNECSYLGLGWAVIRQDGSLNACCMDAHGKYPFGSVWDEPGSWVTGPMPLCDSCNLQVPQELRC